MRIGLIVDRALIPRWVALLCTRLAEGGHGVGLVLVDDEQARMRRAAHTPLLAGLLHLERMLAGSQRHWLADDISGTPEAAALARFEPGTPPDLAIDLTGSFDRSVGARRTLSPRLDAMPVDTGLWCSLVERRAPCISMLDSVAGEVPLALPALSSPQRLYASSEAVLGHLVRALADAALEIAAGRPAPAFACEPPPAPRRGTSARVSLGATSRFMGARLANAIEKRQCQMLKNAAVWQVAWRRAAERTHPPRQIDCAAFSLIRDDRKRYFADPFLIEHAGATHLFVEELPYALGRGIISHVELGPQGPRGSLRPVLEEPHHLSYPQVFHHGGHVYMLPEAAQSGRLTLYRADPFPHRWVRHAVLIEEPLHDATLFHHNDRFWLTATTALASASHWDMLALWSARDVEGPWTAHPGNPVLVDARAARPAGLPYEKDGALWRPAQDCRYGYGAALSLCRFELTPTRFAQQIAATLHYGAPPRHAGPHTINFAGGFEVIDLFAPPPGRAAP